MNPLVTPVSVNLDLNLMEQLALIKMNAWNKMSVKMEFVSILMEVMSVNVILDTKLQWKNHALILMSA